jgi:hypothetical protein
MADENIIQNRGRLTAFAERILQNRLAPHILSVLGLVCVLLVTSWLWVQSRQRFPRLPEGYYFGSLELNSSENGVKINQTIPLFVESTRSDEVFVAPIDEDWKPQLVTVVERGDSGSGTWVHPIVVASGAMRLRFTGAPLASGEYAGTVESLGTTEGTWKLQALTLLPHSSWRMDDADLDHWLRLQSELDTAIHAVHDSKEKVQAQKAEIEQLTEFITDADRLKGRAEKRFLKVKADWIALKESVEQLRLEAKNLERQVALAQRVTQKGTLVSLARESLERESRWVESMFRSEVNNSGAEFMNGVRYGERVMSLREQIAREREKIANLRLVQERRTGIQQEVESFDDLWGQQ